MSSDVTSNTYGVTLSGFVIKPLQQIVSELEAAAQAIWGANVDLDADSPIGQMIGNQAAREYQQWELAQAVYNSINPNMAEGAALDRDCALVNVQRLSASATTATVALYGTAGTAIAAGDILSQSGTGITFVLQSAVTIALTSLLSVQLNVVTVSSGHTYTFYLNGYVVQYTAGGSDTAATIAAALISAANALSQTITITNLGSGSFSMVASDGQTAFAITSLDSDMTATNLASPGVYACTQTGPIACPIGSLNTIGTPVTGRTSVSNLAAGSLGSNAESDTALRIRRPIALFGGLATDDAIATALLNNVAGVTYAKTTSNRTSSADGLGRPAHSFEVVVMGGLNSAIAEQIWNSMPSGIQPWGNASGGVTVTIVDSTGTNQTIQFSRPIPQYIWLNITTAPDSSGTRPANYQSLIKNAIVAWGQALGVGANVKLWAINAPIAAIPGLDSVIIQMAATSTLVAPGSYGTSDITITSEQISLWSAAQILVDGS
jgi:hypothetical protein